MLNAFVGRPRPVPRFTHDLGRAETRSTAIHPYHQPLCLMLPCVTLFAGCNAYQKPCALCAAERSCSACRKTSNCPSCSWCGACRTVYFKARQAGGTIASSAPCRQGKRPRRLEFQLPAEPDRIVLPRDKSGVDGYYAKLSDVSAAVARAGARWFVDVHGRCRTVGWQLAEETTAR